MMLATVDPDGRPSARTVLLKGFDERGAVFFTNTESRKGLALAAHPHAALTFHWDALERQLAIEGDVTPVGDDEADAYFATRPRDSQLGAWASAQSRPLSSRSVLEIAFQDAETRFAGGDVPRPPHWGGYRVELATIIFWQGRPSRLHDRIRYSRDGEGAWGLHRLYP